MKDTARQFLDQFKAAGREVPSLSLRRRSFLRGGGFYVMANWRDGTSLKVARFPLRDAAQYWIEVEGQDWAERSALAV